MYALFNNHGDRIGLERASMVEAEADALHGVASVNPVEVWWLNDMGSRKVKLSTIERGTVTRTTFGEAEALESLA